jgi:hypothetical protein
MGQAGRKHVVENLDYRITARRMLKTIQERLGLQ